MPTSIRPGPRTWSMTRDSDGHREYKIKYMVEGEATDGPANALQTPGLPVPGSIWSVDSDLDIWAWCSLVATVTPMYVNEPNTLFEIEFTFDTRQSRRCVDAQVLDPILEPQKISGTFIKYTEEVTRDVFGLPVLNSAFEPLRGPQVEFDQNRPSVRIEQNVATLGLSLFSSMVDTVNALPLWGLPPRHIKLSNVSWERKYFGLCHAYYTRVFDFDIDYRTFDRVVLDEGTKALNGRWSPTTGLWELLPIPPAVVTTNTNPDPYNPAHYSKYRDRTGEPGKCILNGFGIPFDNTGTETLTYLDVGRQVEQNIQPPTVNPAGVAAPTGLQAVATPIPVLFGHLGVGENYSYCITAITARGESTASNIAEETTTILNQAIRLSWDAYGFRGQRFRIYRKTPGLRVINDLNNIAENGFNLIAEVSAGGGPGRINVVKYGVSNFLLLGIPTILG